MSATSEAMLEEIVELEKKLASAELDGDIVNVMAIKAKLVELRKHLGKVTEMISENKVLKG